MCNSGYCCTGSIVTKVTGMEVTLEPVRRDFDLSESNFAETVESKDDDGGADIKEIKGFCLIAMNPSC